MPPNYPQHRGPGRATSLLAGLAGLLLVLLAPVAVAVGLESPSADEHACCPGEDSAEKQQQDSADAEACDSMTSCAAMTHSKQVPHSCSCHVMPEDSGQPADATGLIGSTFAFGQAVLTQTNLQIDIPRAREPDPVSTSRLDFESTTTSLYLLHNAFLL